MPDRLSPGTILSGGSYGGYTIQRVLGRGGFGVTYSASSQIGLQFAIKEFFPKNTCERDTDSNNIIVTDYSQIELIAKLRRRFIDEANNIAGCDHENIVNVVETFEENGTAYMVMHHVEGVTLQNVIKNNGPMDEPTAREIIIKVAQALKYLHDNNITHLDIKPDNIILRPDGEPVIIDFGLSRSYRDNQGENTVITAVSKGYTAKEQYSKQTRFRPESDVYSLAATYYYMLTGQRPGEPVDMQDYGKKLPSEISKDSRNAIRWGMEFHPSKRTPNMSSFIDHLNGKGKVPPRKTVTPPPPPPEKEKPSFRWYNFWLYLVIVVCIFNYFLYVGGNRYDYTSDALFYMPWDDFVIGLATSSGLAVIGLLIPRRGFKITFTLLSIIATSIFLINFHAS